MNALLSFHLILTFISSLSVAIFLPISCTNRKDPTPDLSHNEISLSQVSCLPNETIVSCGVAAKNLIGGTWIHNESCHSKTGGTFRSLAVARCCIFPADSNISITTISSLQSSTEETTYCDTNTTLTACHVYTESVPLHRNESVQGSFAGVNNLPAIYQNSSWIPSINQCNAFAHSPSAPIKAQSLCLSMNHKYSLECVTKVQFVNHTFGYTSKTFTKCDDGYTMMHCGAYTKDDVTIAHYIIGDDRDDDLYPPYDPDQCHLLSRAFKSMYANAVCCRLEILYTMDPTQYPTLTSNVPSNVPSNTPSNVPSNIPSNVPSGIPSSIPSERNAYEEEVEDDSTKTTGDDDDDNYNEEIQSKDDIFLYAIICFIAFLVICILAVLILWCFTVIRNKASADLMKNSPPEIVYDNNENVNHNEDDNNDAVLCDAVVGILDENDKYNGYTIEGAQDLDMECDNNGVEDVCGAFVSDLDEDCGRIINTMKGPPASNDNIGIDEFIVEAHDDDDDELTINGGVSTERGAAASAVTDGMNERKYQSFLQQHVLLKEWLTETVELDEYYHILVANGYESLDIIKEVTNDEELKEIGITRNEHIVKIMKEIQRLRVK